MAETADRMGELTTQFQNAEGAAEAMAHVMRDNLAGDIDALSGSVETLIIKVGDAGATGALRKMAQTATVAVNALSQSIENYVSGLGVMIGWVERGANAIRQFGRWMGWADEKMAAWGRRAASLAGPIGSVVSLIERLGARSSAQASAERLLTGDFSTNFITDQLAAMGKSIDNINAPDVLPKLGENLAKTGSSGKSAASGMTAAERAAKIIEERFESAANAAANLRRELDAVLAKADPARARGQQLFADIGTLFGAERAGVISPEERQAEGNKLLGQNVPESVKRSKDAAEELMRGMADLGATSKEITTAISDNFAQMADRTLQALDRMVGAIRGGGFLDILSSVINFGIQLGGMGAFGSKIQSNILAGARANGGQVNAGRAYLVGERGPELFMPQAHGQIVANDNMRGGGMTINVDARGSSDPEAVRRQVQQGILEAAPSIVAAAEQRTISTLRRPRLAGVM
jgi:SLT domain-containing protein